MTSEELVDIKRRLRGLVNHQRFPYVITWMNFSDSVLLRQDIETLLSEVKEQKETIEEQQKELDFLRAVVHDMAEESDAIKEVVRLRRATLAVNALKTTDPLYHAAEK